MATLMRVPEVATGVTELILSEWLVAENVPFHAGDPVVVMETEKAVVEVEAEIDGVILRMIGQTGSSVEVGSPLALVGDPSEIGTDLDRLLAELGVEAAAVKALPLRRDIPGVATEPGTGATLQPRIFISPIARKILAQAGIEPADVAGTGPHGRVRRRDAEQAIEAFRQLATPATSDGPSEQSPAVGDAVLAGSKAGPRYQEIPHSRFRRAIAGRLVASKQTTPHFYLKRAVRIDALLELRSQLNDVSDQKISINDLVIRAVATAHVQQPRANVIWTEEAMRQFESVDIAVAIASDRGLVTPVLRGVQNLAPSAIAEQVKAYVQKANDGRLEPRDLEGGSISVTNLGMYGVEEFAAIINPPQSAILAVGAGCAAPVVTDGVVGVATMMSLVLSVDHRAIDGALAALWMAGLVSIIEEPLRMLA